MIAGKIGVPAERMCRVTTYTWEPVRSDQTRDGVDLFRRKWSGGVDDEVVRLEARDPCYPVEIEPQESERRGLSPKDFLPALS